MSKFLLDTLLDVSTTMATSTALEQSNSKNIKIIITMINQVKKKRTIRSNFRLVRGLKTETSNKLVLMVLPENCINSCFTLIA